MACYCYIRLVNTTTRHVKNLFLHYIITRIKLNEREWRSYETLVGNCAQNCTRGSSEVLLNELLIITQTLILSINLRLFLDIVE